MSPTTREGGRRAPSRVALVLRSRTTQGFLFTAPLLVLFAAFVIYPMAFGVWYALDADSYRSLLGPDLPADRGQHALVRGVRRQREAFPGASPLGDPGLPVRVDSGPGRALPDPLGRPGAAGHPVVPLDAQLAVGDLQLSPWQVRLRLGAVARPARHRARRGDRLPHLEVPPVLDDHLPRGAPRDPDRALRGDRDRRRLGAPEFSLRHVPSASEPLPDLHVALDGLHARRLHGALAHDGRRARRLDPRARHARVPVHLPDGTARVGAGDLRGGAPRDARLHRAPAPVGEDMSA